MSNNVSDKELSVALSALFTRLNSLTKPCLCEQILLLEYKLRCASDFTDPSMNTLTSSDVDSITAYMQVIYEDKLAEFRAVGCFGKLRMLWRQFNK